MRPRMGNALQAFGGSEDPGFRFLLLSSPPLRALAWAGLGWAELGWDVPSGCCSPGGTQTRYPALCVCMSVSDGPIVNVRA